MPAAAAKSLSSVQLFANPWTAAYQAPLSMGFSRQEYWSGVPLPSPLMPTNLRQIEKKSGGGWAGRPFINDGLRQEIFYENYKTDRHIYTHRHTHSCIKYIQSWDITRKRKCEHPDFRKSGNQGNSGYIHGKNSWTFSLGPCPTL